MYKDIYGITKIRDSESDRLSISVDFIEEPTAVLLHVPDIEEREHNHIELDKKQATTLRDWLNEFLEDDIEKKCKDDLTRNKARLIDNGR